MAPMPDLYERAGPLDEQVASVLAAIEANVASAREVILAVSRERADADSILEHVGYCVKKRRDATAKVLDQLDAEQYAVCAANLEP